MPENINPIKPIMPAKINSKNILYDSPSALKDQNPVMPTTIKERCCITSPCNSE